MLVRPSRDGDGDVGAGNHRAGNIDDRADGVAGGLVVRGRRGSSLRERPASPCIESCRNQKEEA